jgi:hypothetical protein
MVKNKEAKKNARRSVSEARGRAYDELYDIIGTKEGGNDIYKMAKICERKTRDINQVKCIKDEANRLVAKDEEIKNRCMEYFDAWVNK